MSTPRIETRRMASTTCADCGREIPSKVYSDDVNPSSAPTCVCKAWTRVRDLQGED